MAAGEATEMATWPGGIPRLGLADQAGACGQPRDCRPDRGCQLLIGDYRRLGSRGNTITKVMVERGGLGGSSDSEQEGHVGVG